MMVVVLFAFVASLGLWDSFARNVPLRDSDREVLLVDAYGFGVDYQAAIAQRRAAYQHRSDEAIKVQLRTWNSYYQYTRWEVEMDWRYRCWDALEDALNPRACLYQRLRRLNDLRGLLGDYHYLAREIPSPFPEYRR